MKIRESCLQNGIFIYKAGISLTKQDFKLQNRSFGIQTGLSACNLPQDINVFQTDLQYVLNMIKYRQKKEKILEYVEANRSYFQRLNIDTYQALSVFLNSEKWLEEISVPEGKGEMDMCKALEDIYEDGKIEKLREQVSKKLQKGKSLETIAEELEESAETIGQLAKELSAVEAAAEKNNL